MKRSWVVACVAGLLLSSAAAQESKEIPNLKTAREGVFVSGQPTETGLAVMASRGVHTVINLRSCCEEGAVDLSKKAGEFQINYYNIPLTPDSFNEEKVDEFASILKDQENLPVLVYCNSGNRSAGLWYLYRIWKENADPETALREARELGIKPALEEILVKLASEKED